MSAEPPRAAGLEPLIDGALAQGFGRPPTETVRFDVDAVPLATWGPPSQKSGFQLTVTERDQSYHLVVHTYLFAETILFGASEFTAFTGGPFFSGELPKCGGHATGTRGAQWLGFSPTRCTDEGIDVEMGEGEFDVATCTTFPIASLFARAKALVPGFVYALRLRDAKGDWLYVVLPHGTFVAAGGDPTRSLAASNNGTFARLRFPLAKDTAASAAVRISPASLTLWDELRRTGTSVRNFADGTRTSDALLVTVEVSSQGDVKVASLSFALPQTAPRAAYVPLLRAARSVAQK